MKVLLVCHGRNHRRPAWLKLSPTAWRDAVYLDIDPSSEPDHCCDITKVDIALFEPGSFDAIVCVHCPTGILITQQGRVRRATWSRFERWLRPGGVVVTNYTMTLLFYTAQRIGMKADQISRRSLEDNAADLVASFTKLIGSVYKFGTAEKKLTWLCRGGVNYKIDFMVLRRRP
jgi:hypothetical protein